MELPTYTSIWRIEKRLYKLYDFRLPMPLPVGQIVVFAAITVPYIILLTVFGIPFNHSLFWLYVLPPGLLTWLATRPVLESKRLPELLISQVRYLGEPDTWCRMAPLAERDDIVVFGRVWRRASSTGGEAPDPAATRAAAADRAVPPAASAAAGQARRPIAAPSAGRGTKPAGLPAGRQVRQLRPGTGSPAPAAAVGQAPPGREPVRDTAAEGRHPPPGRQPVRGTAGPTGYPQARGAETARHSAAGRRWVPTGYPQAATDPGPAQHPRVRAAARPAAELEIAHDLRQLRARDTAAAAAGPAAGTPGPATWPAPPWPHPAVPAQLVPARPAPQRPASVAGRAPGGPSGPAGPRPNGWRTQVTAVAGGQRPGWPDHEKEAKARAMRPLGRSRLVVVLGCTVGAGQTVSTLLLADLLATLRGEPVAALDLNPGPLSLTELARVPATTASTILARSAAAPPAQAPHAGQAGHAAGVVHRGLGTPRGARGPGRLDVICQDAVAGGDGVSASLQQGRLLDLLASRYPLTLADPGASAVTKVLGAADQLVLVVPASTDAARAVSVTGQWLGAHGHGALAARSIAMINGVSRRSVHHAEQAELVLRGRCRAIVRVPWDDHLGEPEAAGGIRAGAGPGGGPSRLARLQPPVQQAYAALAGVLISTLAAAPARGASPRGTLRWPGGPGASARGPAAPARAADPPGTSRRTGALRRQVAR